MATINRKIIRGRIHSRIRRKVSGTAERPRLCVYFSGKHVYAQVVDDEAGRTLVSAGTTEKVLGEKGKHARSAVGMYALPNNIAVEVEVIVEVED